MFFANLAPPLTAIGLLVSLAASVAALVGGGTSLRWSVAGLSVCVTALTLNLGLAFSPLFLVPGSAVQQSWQPVTDSPFSPPPARPDMQSLGLNEPWDQPIVSAILGDGHAWRKTLMQADVAPEKSRRIYRPVPTEEPSA